MLTENRTLAWHDQPILHEQRTALDAAKKELEDARAELVMIRRDSADRIVEDAKTKVTAAQHEYDETVKREKKRILAERQAGLGKLVKRADQLLEQCRDVMQQIHDYQEETCLLTAEKDDPAYWTQFVPNRNGFNKLEDWRKQMHQWGLL